MSWRRKLEGGWQLPHVKVQVGVVGVGGVLLSLLGALVLFGMTSMSGLRWLRTVRDLRAVGQVLTSASATLAVGVVVLYGLASTFYSGSANRSRVCDYARNYDLLPVSSSDLPLSTKCRHGAMAVEVVPG